MSRSEREYAWAHFASASLTRNANAVVAAATADKMLEEFEKRFGPCDTCKGRGRVDGVECVPCGGSGDKR